MPMIYEESQLRYNPYGKRLEYIELSDSEKNSLETRVTNVENNITVNRTDIDSNRTDIDTNIANILLRIPIS